MDTRQLWLTPIDDAIYHKFRAEFPELAVEVIEEDILKLEDTKAVSITVSNIVCAVNFYESVITFRAFNFYIQLIKSTISK